MVSINPRFNCKTNVLTVKTIKKELFRCKPDIKLYIYL